YLKIVEAGDGNRHEHFLEDGKISSIHNILFSLNRPTQGAINISTSDSTYYIQSPFGGSFLRMADQFSDTLLPNTRQALQLRSLYNVGTMRFVIPEPVIKGNYGVIAVSETEEAEVSQEALIVDISTDEGTIRKAILGGKGIAKFTDPITIGGLNFSLAFGSKVYELPFKIRLNDFIAEKYPGTEKSYASFMSKVTVEDERPFDYDIYMNHILDHHGYRFFQASFDPDEKGTVLSVNHDFWGTWITYLGYFLLYIGLMGIMFFGKTRFKDLSRSLDKIKAKKAGITTVFVLGFLFSTTAQDHAHNNLPSQAQLDSLLEQSIVTQEHADAFGRLIIQDEGGRMKPINTFASELLRKLSYKNSFRDLSPDQVFLSMMLNPPLWYNIEFIALDKKAENDSLRSIIGVPRNQKYVKATAFFDEKGHYKLAPFLQEAYATNTPDKFQKDFKDVDLRLGLLNRALGGEIVKIFPLLNDENNKWISAVEYRSGKYQVADSLYANFISNSVPYYLMSVKKGIVNNDYDEATKLLQAFHQNQKNHGSEILPSPDKVSTEIIYNRLDIFNRLYKYYALCGLIMFFVLVFAIFKERRIWRIATYFFKGSIVVLFLWHTAGLILRWYISGHAPWSDAYESILYVSWATMGMGLLLGRKSQLTIAAAAFVSSMLLWIAHQSWVDPAIANLVPVLDSYWLMIHVAVIVGSYGPLTVGMILGVVGLLLIILTNEKNKERMKINLREITVINELSLTVGLVMLTIGNFLGGQWANESWGRYWGWDPKETWALISIMVYAFVIHARLVPGLRGNWTFNFLSIIAFGSIMMTYFGVNFYLVGLHSYASGAQVITPV
ncbi:MAG: cytochrome c biogenesis protein CcsA, partial [Flavobacteriaceae bacterium]